VIIKYLVIGLLVLILISLGRALFHMTSNKQEAGTKMVTALTWRIGLSVALFLLLILAYYNHWIDPAVRP
jgi:hypothetical protein